MKIVNSALQAACVLPDFSEDPDLVDYFRYLREYLLDCITCIFHCLQEIEQSDTFLEHVPTLINFINTICNDRYDPSVVRKL
jgi:hypothetical protein